MGKSQRTKGAAFERLCAKLLSDAMPGAGWRRNLQPQGGRVAGNDLAGPCFGVECKHGIKPNIRAALEQATRDSGKELWPIAITRDNGGQTRVTLWLGDFLELLQAWWIQTR